MEKAKVLVIGAGPAGIGVATGLARRGIAPIILIDRGERVGGVPSLYKRKPGGVPTFVLWTQGRFVFGEQMAEHLARKLQGFKVEVWTETQVIEISPDEKNVTLVNPSRGRFQVSAEAVVLACGAREKTAAERGWIFGSRPSGLLFTKNLLDLVDQCNVHVAFRPVILGSDLIAYAASAKLKSAGALDAVIVDRSRGPDCSLPARFFFRHWARPRYRGGAQAVTVAGTACVSTVTPANSNEIRGDLLMICGDLVPNTDLALMGNMRVDLPSRRAAVGSDYQLSTSGWFAAGNILGNYHGAEWCYFNGRRVARQVEKYLRRTNPRGK
jgi:thioredoxin reductase